jgi:hypothetical protein
LAWIGNGVHDAFECFAAVGGLRYGIGCECGVWEAGWKAVGRGAGVYEGEFREGSEGEKKDEEGGEEEGEDMVEKRHSVDDGDEDMMR